MTRRIAIADLGSNTIKLSVTEVDANGRQRVIDTDAHTVRLSAGLGTTGAIEPARIDRTIEVLGGYEQRAAALGADAFRGVATAAVRMASNGSALIDRIGRETGWTIRVISGEEEARLTFMGLVDELPAQGAAIIADIGGASSELVRVMHREPIHSQSVQIGSGTLADRSFVSDPPGIEAVRAAQQIALATLTGQTALDGSDGAWLFLSGGNGVFLSQVAVWERVRLPFVTPFLTMLVEQLAGIPGAEVADYLAIAEERARMLPAGGAIALALVELVRPGNLVAVPSGIRGGLVHEWVQAGRPGDSPRGSAAFPG